MYERLFKRQENIFKVIANQKRLEILQLLTHGELDVSDMVEMLGISQSNVSQHLSLLRRSGIVLTRKEGTKIYYRLTDEKIAQACSLVRQFLVGNGEISAKNIIDNEVEAVYPLVKDLVCGMRMGVLEAPEFIRHEKNKYYFCARGCKTKFKLNPEKYLLKY